MTKLASFSQNGQHFYGVVKGDGLIAVSPSFPEWSTLKEVLENNGLDAVIKAADGKEITHKETEIQWEIPIPSPEKIICVGVNFPDRNAEYKDGKEAPPNMSLFPRFPRSFVGHKTPLTRPPESPQLDYEGEIAVVIGKGGRRIPQNQALDHIAGLTLCNEGTIRDWVRHAKFNVTQGKNWEGSGAMGPWLIPFTSHDQILDVELRTRVNGEQRQEDRTGRMLFPVAKQIAYISTFTTLVPGDVIVTGTPTGAGARHDPPIWLKPGDEIEVEAEGIGVLRNGVRDE